MTAQPKRAVRPLRPGVPGVVAVFAAVGVLALLLPLAALVARVQWSGVWAALSSPSALDALRLSFVTASIATVLTVLLGLPYAILLSRATGLLASALRALATLPLVLPPLVSGLALLSLFGRTGLLGDTLSLVGIRVPFTTAAVIIAQTFVALPFLIIALEGALRNLDPGFARVAESLGAGGWRVLLRVQLPLIAPSLAAGVVLGFTRALGEFGATALFAGNAEGTTRTMPLAIYTAFNGAGVREDTAIALSLVLILAAIVVLLLFRSRVGGSVR